MVARITQLDHGFEPSNLIVSVLSVTLLPSTLLPQLRIHFLFSFLQFLLHSDVLSPLTSACDVNFSRLFSLTSQSPAL